MRSRRVASFACALIVAAGCAESSALDQSAPKPMRAEGPAFASADATAEGVVTTGVETDTASIGPFGRRRAMDHVRALAGRIGVRVRATEGERRGARYIKRRFEDLGYEVFVQRFSVDGGTSRNVVASWPGARRYPIVLGGHMDSVPTSPGANDNASGVAVLLEIARLVRDTDEAGFLRFIAFGSEEYGSNGSHHVGSQVFVNRLTPQGRRKMGGMISVDMIADGRPLIVGSAGIGPDVLARILYRKLNRAGFAVEYRTTCDCSDNGPFERAGIPGSFMWSGPESNYHDSSDTVANMSPADLERTGKALRLFIVRTVDQALLDRLRRY
ncbi:MAG: M28 family peptidase [Actinomycetota bacterium]